MVDFDRLVVRFRQFGGWRLVVQYARMGVLWIGVKEIIRCAVTGRSMKAVYPKITERVDEILKGKYGPSKSPLKGDLPTVQSPPFKGGREGPYVWSCWLQGWDRAPELAKACLNSLKRNLTDVEIVELDDRNYTEWVTLPEYVVEKYRKGRIPPAMFSDMLRLELLAVHGGVWIDSTVLASGPSRSPLKGDFNPSWEEIVNAELFVFQYTKPGQRFTGNVSNWFIASKKGNPFIITLRDMLYAYWRDYDVALEYYICHLFFKEVAKLYPEQIAKMPYGWSTPSISLGAHLGARFSEKKWQQFTSQVHWHKMSYRKEKELKKNPNNYYNHIIKEYLSTNYTNLTKKV